MRVLIFGATGFAGRYLVDELRRRGCDVIGAGRRVDPAPEARHPIALDALPMHRCDVTDPAQVRAVLASSRPDAAVLLSGVASPPLANRDPRQAYAVHAMGAVNVLEEVAIASPRRIRVLVVTSSEAYGSSGIHGSPLDEDAALRPTTIYAASKAAADLAAGAFASARGVDVIRVRPFNHTGPGQRPDFVCPDFAGQVAAIASGRRPPVIEVGNLDVTRDFLDVRDVARGYADALERGRSGEIYNLCSGHGITIRSILDDLCALAGVRPEIRVLPERHRVAEVPAYWGSGTRAAASLRWVPTIPWRLTLADLLDWCRTNEGVGQARVE
ncbi:MAG: NAD-dependent epimerase/dehydratase family protein [Deltaproteobacteria bacterium]|nr:NAD-dependent epimerase/dehydratase family protein [Deltaproteobacteria bacterium]